MPTPDVRHLRRMLADWQHHRLTTDELHAQAERMFEAEDWPRVPLSDHRAIALEVLTLLDALNHQLVVEEDVPELLAFLDTVPGMEAGAWKRWHSYWDAVDFKARARQLEGRSPYFP